MKITWRIASILAQYSRGIAAQRRLSLRVLEKKLFRTPSGTGILVINNWGYMGHWLIRGIELKLILRRGLFVGFGCGVLR